MKTALDWSAFDSFGESDDEGDARSRIPVSGGGFGKAAAACNGVRQCQRDQSGVMCPSYRVTHDARHSTQHRASSLRAALNGDYGDAPFSSAEFTAAMELCVACKGCRRDCPNGVDMSALRSEALAQRWQTLGRVPLRERFLAGAPRWLPWLRKLRWLTRLRERSPSIGKMVQALLGIAARRSAPQVAPRSFLGSQPKAVFGPPEGRELALFVDTFSNELDPANAQAALDLLLAAGYRVHLVHAPRGERPLCCGRTWYSAGLIDRARVEAERLVDALWPLVARGMPVIGLEPSCLLMLRDEYHILGLGDRIGAISRAAQLLEEFLAHEHDAKRLALCFVDAGGAKVAVHGHCHQKSFGAMKAMRKVLDLVPGLQTEVVESSCCGMAGSFGFKAEHFEISMQMGELALLPALRATPASTRIVANGTSCRHQIRDGAKRESVHLARLLRDALADE